MGIDICGWVEISDWGPENFEEEYAWTGVIRIAPLMYVCDVVSELLFGFSKRALCGEKLPYVPIAANRGIPSNPSQEVVSDMKSIAELEQRFGPGEFRGYTSIDISEIDAIDWARYEVDTTRPSGWWVLLRMIDLLRSDQDSINRGIRLVCWVCW
jgi:hypothetical protein